METARIADLLQPFTAGRALSAPVLEQLQRYLELLLLWNARINLTAIRDPELIVARHFGESLFAAAVLLDVPHSKAVAAGGPGNAITEAGSCALTLADVGSGAGFPGVPIKLFSRHVNSCHLNLTLIESQNKKATFLRELVRTLQLDAAVFCGRAEQWGHAADLITMRAVEQFESALPAAARLVAPAGRLCLLIGAGQADTARRCLADWTWGEPVAIPQSAERTVLIAKRA